MARLLGGQIHGIQTHVNGLTNAYICIKFEEDTTYGYFDIEANVKMLTVRPTDRDIDFVKTYPLVALKCIFTKVLLRLYCDNDFIRNNKWITTNKQISADIG